MHQNLGWQKKISLKASDFVVLQVKLPKSNPWLFAFMQLTVQTWLVKETELEVETKIISNYHRVYDDCMQHMFCRYLMAFPSAVTTKHCMTEMVICLMETNNVVNDFVFTIVVAG